MSETPKTPAAVVTNVILAKIRKALPRLTPGESNAIWGAIHDTLDTDTGTAAASPLSRSVFQRATERRNFGR